MAELDWASLLARATEEEGEEQLTEDLLARWLARNGSLAGAVYLSDGGRLVLEHRLGTEELPEVIQGELPSEFQFHHLPGGLLLYQGGSRSEQGAEAIDLALALAVRLASLKREVKRYDFEAGMREVEQQALYDVGLAITSTLDLEQLSEAILTWALALLDARRAALYLQDGNEYTLARSLGGEAVEVATTLDPHQDPSGLLPGASFLLLAPIEVEGNPRGLLVVGDKESRSGVGPFGEADQRTLALFANQAAISLENARLHREALDKQRLEREMELAAEIQRQI
ncbi:MAG TPA: GAF domain-containing protein, partial [Thermoanaerobaculia bacterium]|nr:GAF domain-containing protein [Thermoanaerobaculia bacterium]